jgi:hypothetical protein
MPVPQSSLTGDVLLAAVTDAMVALHERHHHRAPVTAKTSMIGDDLLVCMLGGVYIESARQPGRDDAVGLEPQAEPLAVLGLHRVEAGQLLHALQPVGATVWRWA